MKYIVIFIIIILFVSLFSFACTQETDSPESVLPLDSPTPEPTPEVAREETLFVSGIRPADTASDDDVTEPDYEPFDHVAERIAEIVDSMSLHEKICQMLIVTLDSFVGVAGVTLAGEATQTALEEFPVGGIIHFPPNIVSGEQIKSLNSALQRFSNIPLLIAVDEEGGRVARLRSTIGAHSVRAMLTYEEGGEETAFENAILLSDALKAHGFNTNFAPVADVWSNPSNRVIGDRAYSTDFSIAAELVAAAVRGFAESNVACSLKHFPGHGNTREDSHHSTAYVNRTLDELREEEFLPFVSGIAAGADMVMTGHLIVPEVDELPATLSFALLTDILRGELGFDGVIITDSLAMNAISRHFSVEFVAVNAVSAGVDIILMPVDVEETVAALVAAVRSGEISESRIEESVRRIIRLKMDIGIVG